MVPPRPAPLPTHARTRLQPSCRPQADPYPRATGASRPSHAASSRRSPPEARCLGAHRLDALMIRGRCSSRRRREAPAGR
jgi:hypothetical protein